MKIHKSDHELFRQWAKRQEFICIDPQLKTYIFGVEHNLSDKDIEAYVLNETGARSFTKFLLDNVTKD
jgi:hypothetical protein